MSGVKIPLALSVVLDPAPDDNKDVQTHVWSHWWRYLLCFE